MPQFNMNNMSLRQNILRQEQLKKALKNKQHENKEDTKSATDNAELQEITPENKVVKDVIAELDIMAEQNRAILNAHRNSSSGTSMVDRNQNTNSLDHVGSIHMRDVGFSEIDLAKIGDNLRYVTDEPLPPSNIDNNETENSDNNPNIYANKEKYTQEYIDGLNIGIDISRFRCIIEDYFQKVTISGEEVYVLKSGTLTQVVDLISQIYVTEKLVSTPDFIPNPPDENSGYALVNQSTYDNRKANYYYMCYLNGITCTGHEFEDGTYNKEIARQCGLYEYEDVFAKFVMDEDVQNYLQENFGITISTPPSEEYIELWNKLANLAAIGEDGKNTGEYNKYNVLKYFGLALSDSKFMNYVDKLSFEPEENSILDNSWDIEAVKSVISERYPELLENTDVFTDEFLEWIGSNAFEFLLYNQSKLRANGLQDFVNYGNIPSWITFNNGTEFNKELLLKCCIQSMAKLADIGNKLGYEPKEFVNRNIADYVTDVYQTLMENSEETQATGGPRRAASNPQIPDYVMNQLWSHFGHIDFTFDYDDYSSFIRVCNENGDNLVYIELDTGWAWYENKVNNDSFRVVEGFSFKNGEIVENGYFDANEFWELYYSESKLPAEQRQFFTNGLDDLYQYIKDNIDFEDLCSIISFLIDPPPLMENTVINYDEDGMIVNTNFEGVYFYSNLRREIFEGENNDIYQYLYNTLSNNLQTNGFTDLLRMMPASSDNATDISALFYFAGNRISSFGFDWNWNTDGIILNTDAGQGQTSNCWFVAYGIAMAQHPEILQLIKDYSIEIDDENRTYTVTLGGQKYTYTFDEIMSANELSSGDIDFRVFEMAAREILGPGADNQFAKGGCIELALGLFAGNVFDFVVNDYNGEYWFSGIIESKIDEILEHIKSGTYISEISVFQDGYWAIDMETGEKVEIHSSHTYTIVGGDDNYIYIVNPWDSSKTLRLSIATIKNNLKDFRYMDISVDDFSRAIQNANKIVPNEIREKLENGSYFAESGDFDYNQYYNDCIEFGMNSSNLEFMFDKSADGSKLSIFNPDGTCTIVFKTTSGQIQIIEIGRLTPSFVAPDGVPFDIDNFTDEQLIEELHKSLDDISLFIMEDGEIDRDLLSSMLPKFTVGGWFDSSALMILMQYYKNDDGSIDAEGFKQLLSNFSNYNDVERFAQSVLKYEQVQAAMMSNNAQAAIYALQSWAEDRIAKLKNSGSIYNEMDYWQWSDVLTNPLASTEDYIAAINAMNSILNAAKSIGVSLDAYIHMNPAERERRRGMLTTPMNDEILIEPWNIVPVDENDGEEGVGMYYSTPNQSSCYSAPEWFVEAYLNGEIPDDDDEITWNVLNETCTEAEEKLFFERQHYWIWQMTNSSLLIGLPPTEAYGLYMMDMMYFSMWLNTDAIIEGYDQDTTWEDLYEAYSNSDMKLF